MFYLCCPEQKSKKKVKGGVADEEKVITLKKSDHSALVAHLLQCTDILHLDQTENSSSLNDCSSEESREHKELQPERKCLEDFKFLSVLGRGTFGNVILSELKGTDEVYALKIMKEDNIWAHDVIGYTLREKRILTLASDHPYLTHLFCSFQTIGRLWPMEGIVDGKTTNTFCGTPDYTSPEMIQSLEYATSVDCRFMTITNRICTIPSSQLNRITHQTSARRRVQGQGECHQSSPFLQKDQVGPAGTEEDHAPISATDYVKEGRVFTCDGTKHSQEDLSFFIQSIKEEFNGFSFINTKY
ncbi:hypothetical protein Q7C36_000445 [Tachysurus vachellii]|uniref:non-specific serine/threonine protein kinase n=1 Tax=Tachysurus vachellii TaxID=175792 RepID=A0AA88P152_TACVA|nr:hypothetical protein Q7C36_000445 [Tachysurus vachellii]